MSTDWIDVSVPLRTGMVHWPDNPPVKIERVMDLERGDVASVSSMAMGVHTGTHMDAPAHFQRGGVGIDRMPLDATLGLARVIEIQDSVSIKRAELEAASLQPGERVLFRTRNSERCWQTDAFIEDFVFISRDAAAYLAERRVRTVGVDYLSVGGFREDAEETHLALLQAGIWVIEGLNLSSVRAGAYELICLPLRIEGGDGAPARAVLRPHPG
ncbi:cyclase family protein [Hyalangium rubrum]|uniref:Cyclase family protein n=1 Tax=Hyalangium rubrum TaxID=3103134 RepID=A0ABU5GV21_9BACT|nr:cyclase family protein [Hyalangium sp. s54d21]MDY7224752.1 cyclase family protein [Hyalangium sp. s54d21]